MLVPKEGLVDLCLIFNYSLYLQLLIPGVCPRREPLEQPAGAAWSPLLRAWYYLADRVPGLCPCRSPSLAI